jgi:hypothetical protein
MNIRAIIIILLIGLLSACGSQPADSPASPPTEEPVTATDTSANPPASVTETALPPTEVPAEAPTLETAASGGVSFANDILPILKSRCVNCHGGDRIEEGLLMRSYAELMAGSDNGLVIVPGDADGSLLVEMVVSREMPKRGPKLTPPQTQLIIDWVNQGAVDN